MSTVRPVTVTFADLLRRFRKAAGLTQEELAAAAGLSTRAVSDLERGLRRSPHTDTVRLLAEALKLTDSEREVLALAAKRGRTASAALVGVAGPTTLRSHPMAAPGVPLVGRRHQLAVFEHHLAAEEGPPVLLLAGEPGIGKTRLLQEGMRLAASGGWTVLEGGCQRRNGQMPYSPLLEAIERYVTNLSPVSCREQMRDCEWLVRLLPELAAQGIAPAPRWALGPEQERRLMFAAVARLLANAAGPAGTLLVLDDLQWADPDALDLLAALLHAPTSGALRVLGAYRDTELAPGDPLGILMGDLAREGLLERASLGPLTGAETRELLGYLVSERADSAVWERVAARSGGVPFFVLSLARAVPEAPPLPSAGGERATADTPSGATAEQEVPWTVAQSILQRVAALPQAAQELLGMAAVVGRLVPAALLLAVADRPEAEVLGLLEAICDAHLLVERSADAYEFAHDLVREMVERDLSAARRRMLHRQVAEAMERAAASYHAEALADHFALGGHPERALPYVLLAGDQARAIFAHSEAQQRYRQALELASEVGDRGREAEALEKLANELRTVTHFDEAFELSERAVALYRALEDVEGEGRVLWLMCWQHLSRSNALGWELARIEAVLAAIEVRVEELRARGLSVVGQARLFTALALAFLRRGELREEPDAAGTYDWPRALAAAEEAIELAQAATDEEALAHAMYIRAHTLLSLGRLDESMRDYEGVAASAEAAGTLDLAVMALTIAQCTYQYSGEFDTSRRCIERAVALLERTGNPRTTAFVIGNRGELAYCTGDWDRARSDYEQAAATMRAVETTMTFSFPKLNLGVLCLAQGQWAAAADYLAEPLALAERTHDQQTLRIGHGMLAERDLLEGHPEAARARLEPLLERWWVHVHQIQYVLPQLAWAHLQLGDEPRALALVGESRERARADCQAFFLVDALRVQALVATRQGHWQEAEDALEESIGLCRGMPYPYAEAKALYVYGQLYAAMGKPEQARDKYAAALAICERLGEGLYRPHIERALAELNDSTTG